MFSSLFQFRKVIERVKPCYVTLIKSRFCTTNINVQSKQISKLKHLTHTIRTLGYTPSPLGRFVQQLEENLAAAKRQGLVINVITMNTILQVFKYRKCASGVIQYYNRLKTNIKPDLVTFTILVSSLNKDKNYEKVASLYREFAEMDLPLDAQFCCAVLRGLMKSPNRDLFFNAVEYFKSRGVYDIQICHTMIEAYIEWKEPPEKIYSIFYDIILVHFKPNPFTFGVLLEYAVEQNDDKAVNDLTWQASLYGIAPSEFMMGSYIKHALNLKDLDKAQSLVEQMVPRYQGQAILPNLSTFLKHFVISFPKHKRVNEARALREKLYSTTHPRELKEVCNLVIEFIRSLRNMEATQNVK